MNTPSGSRLERVLADFAELYGALTRAREQLRALSVTARSRDGVVEVTVGADGRPTDVRFVDQRFRAMAARRLGDSILEALATARTEVAARTAALTTVAEGLTRRVAVRGPGTEAPGAPLWGRGLAGAYSPAPHIPLPAELREAVTALREAVCDAVRTSRAVTAEPA